LGAIAVRILESTRERKVISKAVCVICTAALLYAVMSSPLSRSRFIRGDHPLDFLKRNFSTPADDQLRHLVMSRVIESYSLSEDLLSGDEEERFTYLGTLRPTFARWTACRFSRCSSAIGPRAEVGLPFFVLRC